jgi:hypothetical protein
MSSERERIKAEMERDIIPYLYAVMTGAVQGDPQRMKACELLGKMFGIFEPDQPDKNPAPVLIGFPPT